MFVRGRTEKRENHFQNKRFKSKFKTRSKSRHKSNKKHYHCGKLEHFKRDWFELKKKTKDLNNIELNNAAMSS